MSKHTPEPWTLKRGLHEKRIESEGWSWYVAGPYDEYGAAIVLADTRMDHEIGEANARLIAAAPELLAACKAMDSVDRDGWIPWVHNAAITSDIEKLRSICLHYSEVWNKLMRHAIAKAEATPELQAACKALADSM